MDYQKVVKEALNRVSKNPSGEKARTQSIEELTGALESAYQQGAVDGERAGYTQGVKDGAREASSSIGSAYVAGMQQGASISLSLSEPEEEEDA